ncbi:MAG: hypothetical protein HQ453_13220 [Actinobacteria bacterium]|nr:hypothetical protein [Actinomycetota bacterium]
MALRTLGGTVLGVAAEGRDAGAWNPPENATATLTTCPASTPARYVDETPREDEIEYRRRLSGLSRLRVTSSGVVGLPSTSSAIDDEPKVVGMDDQVVYSLVSHALGQGDLDMTSGPPGRHIFAFPPEFPDRSEESIAHTFVDRVQ